MGCFPGLSRPEKYPPGYSCYRRVSAVILALAAGAVVGLALGALGGGGSVPAVPALIHLLGFSPVGATTASLVIVTLTSATALSVHARGGRGRAGDAGRRARRPCPGGRTDGGLRRGRGSGRPAHGAVQAGYGGCCARVAGAGLGAVTGVLGVGGGFLAVPALVSVLGMRMRNAVGTSLLVPTVNSLAALATRAGTVERLDWAVVGPFVGTAILGAWDGKRLAAKVSGARFSEYSPWCCWRWRPSC